MHEHTKELYKMAIMSYSRPYSLLLSFFGDHRISSDSGCQQGDPAAPLSFSLVLRPILTQLRLRFVASYLNDLTFAEPDPRVVADDLRLLRCAEATTGLLINYQKRDFFRLLRLQSVPAQCPIGTLPAPRRAQDD